ncbi:MAG: AEC family transporter [Phormidium sp. BM_Day4_Bin.17]|nr:AEC family transporter [Phormidium sp. BM_Day4_Bin.17]UCJ13028.1 MAG: AEC family transporter [Phormidium sp. PBR-2020]
MTAILSAILPVLTIVLIGFWAGKTFTLDRVSLSRITLYIFTPALVAESLYRSPITLANAKGLFLAFSVTYALMGAIAWGLSGLLRFSASVRKSAIATSAFPNTGNMGLSVSLFAFGEEGLNRAAIVLIISSLLVFSTGPAILKGGGFTNALKFTLKLPLIWAMLMGLALRLLPFELPFQLDRVLQVLADGTIPVALVVLGIEISQSSLKLTRYDLFASGLRLLGGGAVAYAVGQVLGLEGLDLQVLVLQCSMPAAVSSFLMVKEFGGDTVRTARVVAMSSVLAFGTLPLVLGLLSLS